MRELVITKREEGQRLDRFLCKYLPEAPSGFLHKMLRKKNVKLNDGKAAGNEKIKQGDRIQIYFSEETLDKFTGRNSKKEKTTRALTQKQKELRGQVKVLYATEDVLILHKPAGMLTQKAEKEDDSLNDYLIDYCLEKGILTEEGLTVFRPSVANRLDRNTSGIVLCGISMAGLQALGRLMKERNLEKYYLCLVHGRVEQDRKLKGWLLKDEKTNRVRLFSKPVEGAAPIETWYQVLEKREEVSLLKIRLITGKSHQIRAHLASVGHPILGDGKYASGKMNQEMKKEGIRYQLLHSYELKVPDNVKGLPEELSGLHITAPLPSEFLTIMKKKGFSEALVKQEGRRR